MLSVDGDCEQSVRVDLALVEDHHAKIVVVAELADDRTFDDLGAVSVGIDGELVSAATATLDAAVWGAELASGRAAGGSTSSTGGQNSKTIPTSRTGGFPGIRRSPFAAASRCAS